jgi:hypothetical protein
MSFDKALQERVKAQRVIAPIAIGANATKTGKIIDRAGYGGVEFIASYGAVTTTGTIVTLVAFEGDVTGTMTSIADATSPAPKCSPACPCRPPRAPRKSARTSPSAWATRARSATCASTRRHRHHLGRLRQVEALLFNPESGIPTNP